MSIDAETYYTKKIKGEVSGITFSVADRPILYLFGDSITQYSSKVRPSWVSGIWSVLLISNDMLVIAASFHYFFSKLDILTSIFSSPVPYLASNRAFARVFRTTVRYHIAGGPAGLGHPAGRFVHSLLPLRGHSESRLLRVCPPARSSYTGCRSCQPATGERLTHAVMACCAFGTGGGRDGRYNTRWALTLLPQACARFSPLPSRFLLHGFSPLEAPRAWNALHSDHDSASTPPFPSAAGGDVGPGRSRGARHHPLRRQRRRRSLQPAARCACRLAHASRAASCSRRSNRVPRGLRACFLPRRDPRP